jgi:DNA-binding NtrC family response regulator
MKDRSIKVLVMGGDPETGRELLAILWREGYQAELATSLSAGMTLIDSRQFGVLILDLNMFRGNEMVLLSQIREKDRDLPIVALGDLAPEEAVVSSMRKLILEYLKKPVSKADLIEAVRSLALDRKQQPTPRDDLLATIGARIRAERKNQDLTLKQVAERTRLSVSLLSQIERAESAASVASLYKIASALKVPLQSFFDGF